MELTPLTIINNLRDADYYMQVIFTQGACYKFHLFLKSLFPNSTALINSKNEHYEKVYRRNIQKKEKRANK